MKKYDQAEMLNQISEKWGNRIEISQDNFFTFLRVAMEDLPALLRILKDNYSFNHLANLTAVDLESSFEMVYHLYSIPENYHIAVKSRVLRDNPEVPSATDIWPGADWQEREVYDLMGIKFSGHPNLIRVLLPEDFSGHPLRKDFKREEG